MAANHWPPEGWDVLEDDDDFVIGREWRTEEGVHVVHIIRVTDMDAACGRDDEGHPPYVIELLEFEPNTLDPSTIESALDSCGLDSEWWVEANLISKAHVLMSYGTYAPLDTDSAKRGYQGAVRRMVRESEDIEGHPAVRECHLNRPVNGIGSTAREFGRGDLTSAMKRLIGTTPEETEKRAREAACLPTDAKVETTALGECISRRVPTKKMSSECIIVQVWGLPHCKTCEYRDTADCGGEEIRKTGKNSNGFKVPLKEGAEYDDGSEGANRTRAG